MARARHRLAAAGAAGALALIGAGAWILGPGGPWLVGRLAQDRSVWRLGKLSVSDVSGRSLGDLSIARATLRDAQGVWLEAEAIEIDWRPLAVLSGDIRVLAMEAGRVRVLRRPTLSAPGPKGLKVDLSLKALRLAQLKFEKDVFGAAADFRIDGALDVRDGAPQTAQLTVTGLGETRDGAALSLTRTDAFALAARLDGPAGGFFSRALGATQDVRIDVSGRGDPDRGEGALSAKIGAADFATASLAWTKQDWRAQAQADLGRAPALRALARATGDTIEASASGARNGDRHVQFSATAPHAELHLTGPANGPFALRARAAHLEAVAPGVSRGVARFEGTMERASAETLFKGRLDATAFRSGVLETDFSGPVTVRVGRRFADIDGQATLSRPAGAAVMQRLIAGSALKLDGRYDRETRRVTLRSATLEGPKARVTAVGVLGPGAAGVKGRWRIIDARAVDARFSGAAAGDYTLKGGFSGAPFALSLKGVGERFVAGLGFLDPLLGPRPTLEAELSIKGRVVTAQRMSAQGPRLRLGARGTIDGGVANLAVEASGKGPINLGAATVEGVADATGTLTGPLETSTLTMQTQVSSIDAGGLIISRPVVTFTLQQARAGSAGRIGLTGSARGAKVTAAADLRFDGATTHFDDIVADVAGVTARGTASLSPTGPAAQLTLGGVVDTLAAPVRGGVVGAVTLTPQRGAEPRLSLDARLDGANAGALRIRTAHMKADGPLSRLAVRATLQGAASGALVDLDLAGTMAQDNGQTRLSLTPSGALAGAAIHAQAPMEIDFSRNGARARIDVQIADGAARFDFADRPNSVQLSATLDNAPLAPIAALFGESMTGRATGSVTMSGNGELNGDIDMRISDALLARRARDPVAMTLTGRIANGALTLTASATSRNGLDAALDATAPVTARARPLRIALAGEGRATWRAKGPADALWGLVGSLDQNVSGDLKGEGVLRFSARRLSGEGGLRLTNGRFNDRPTGIDLKDIAADLAFDSRAARLERFFARDARGGEISGSGVAQGLESGRIDLVARGVRLLGRPDAQATGSGPLSLVWTQDGARLTGDLTLDSALITPIQDQGAIAELEVIEINRPGGDPIEETSAPARAPNPLSRTALDVRVRANDRVMVRGRGLDSEWSLDLRVQGSVLEPRMFGEARLVRGRFTLAGRPFEAERGVIRFNGDPQDALIDLAARLDAPSLSVVATLQGPVRDPEATLSSTPSLPEDEILPQALFGRAAADLSAFEAAQLAASLAELAGRSSLNLTGVARDIVGLDRLDVRETTGGLRVAGGKYLTRSVYLEVARSGVGETETQVEWRVRPQLNIVSAFQPAGDSRLSVRWRREY